MIVEVGQELKARGQGLLRVITVPYPECALVQVAPADQLDRTFWIKTSLLGAAQPKQRGVKGPRPLRLPKSTGVFGFEPWVDHLLRRGVVNVASHERCFDRFAASYYELTGEELTRESPGVMIRTGDVWALYGLRVRWHHDQIDIPAEFHVYQRDDRHQFEIAHNELCWDLIRLGLRIGDGPKEPVTEGSGFGPMMAHCDDL